MKRTIITTESAPAAVGPYSQAVKTGNLVFCSGQIPLVTGTKNLASGGIEEQTRQCLKNLTAVMEAAGSSLQAAVKLQIFITKMKNFPKVNAVYSEFFMGEFPARFCVEVSALPLGALIEIDAIGVCE
ncbi:MAG: Rid family detoxifying hydrolase [Spirochaetales bacterium]|nr:Rid family detoxifying hydrolase [Spirochaetales bacterium]